MSLSRTVSKIFSVKEWIYLKTGVGVGRSRSLKMAPFDIRLSIDPTLYIYTSILYRFLSYLMSELLDSSLSLFACYLQIHGNASVAV